MADQDRFCAICERKLVEKDSEHVCRTCFKKAREPKATVVHLSDEGAERLGLAYAFGKFVNLGIQKLAEMSGTKLPPPAKTPEEEARRQAEARDELKRIQRRIQDDNRGIEEG